MQIIDLTHKINDTTPVYPGTPEVKVETFATVEVNGFREKLFHIASHVGTHMDAPAHMIAGGKYLDDFPVHKFIGSAVLIDVRTYGYLELAADLIENLPPVDFVLFYSGWDRKWGQADYFTDFPYPGIELAKALVSRGVKAIGIDTVSVDAVQNTTYPIHHELLENEVLIIENLTNLQHLPGEVFQFMSLPINITEADGAPVRAVAMIEGVA